MKHQRALLVLALAGVLGAGAVLLASRWLVSQGSSRAGRVVVAAQDVNLGQRLAPDMLKLVDWPADSLPKGAFPDPLKLSGRVLRSTVLRGEPLSEAKLAPAGTLGGLSALITEGKRALTVRVNDVIGVAGFALPGNFVDIIVNTEQERSATGGGRASHISKIVLERILVLAVAQEVSRDDTKPHVVNAVTLEVSPEQAENLDLARSVGTLSLALRNQVDPAAAGTEGATKRSLLLLEPPDPPAPNAPPAERAPAARAPLAAARPPPRPALALARLQHACVGVIDGLRVAKECF